MSAKFNMKVSNVKTTRKPTSRARVSTTCTCKDDHKSSDHKSCDHKSCDHKSCCHKSCDCHKSCCHKSCCHKSCCCKKENLDDIFKQLKDKDVAEKFIRAIRCRDARAVEMLLDCKCRVVCFFCTPCKDCVRICCAFCGCHDVTTTFDICVKKELDVCCRNNFWF